MLAQLDLPFAPAQGLDLVSSSTAIVNHTNSRGFPALDAQDRVLVPGNVMERGETATYLVRFDSRMKRDLTFGPDSTGLTEIGNRALGTLVPYSAAVDASGRVIIGGQMTAQYASPNSNWNAESVQRLKGDSVVVTVVEFYNPSLDHYFVTWKKDEIAKLDAGTEIKGWVRTGSAFNAFTKMQPGTVPVCRFYIPPGQGDSHFFGRDTAECNSTAEKFPSFVLEDAAFMYLALPTAGMRAARTTPIYRAFSNRSDANHRYMTDPTLRDAMIERGWTAEGDGPDRVVMCAPQ